MPGCASAWARVGTEWIRWLSGNEASCHIGSFHSGSTSLQQAGESKIAASRAQVWAALNDPHVLAQCIEGCESMERTGDNQFVATVRAKVGPVSASFKGEVTLADLVPGTSYKLIGSGTGGAAGFARGEANVALSDDVGGGTLLSYTMEAKVGGKLAQIGSRLVDGAARKMADEFFNRFRAVLEADADSTLAVDESGAMSGAINGAMSGAMNGGMREHGSSTGASAVSASTVEHAAALAARTTNQQWIIWAVVFGVLVLALLMSAL